MTRLLIIGGSDAGISAGLRARELDPDRQVTLLVADDFPNYSVCGLPYYHSGEVARLNDLAHRSRAELEAAGLTLRLHHFAEQIDPVGRTVRARTPEGPVTVPYDALVIATGALATAPDLPGVELPGVYTLHEMGDSVRLEQHLRARSPATAVIVGGGYIGLEMAEALTRRGLKVTLLSRPASVLPTLHPTLGRLIETELQDHGVDVRVHTSAERIEPAEERLTVFLSTGEPLTADLVLVAAGVQPNTRLATSAGVRTGIRGALQVDRQMRTGIPQVFAAGDCVETHHQLLPAPTYLPLGTTAHKQGQVAGENAVGGQRTFRGSVGTQVVKVFDRVAARTGLNDTDAQLAGYDPLTVAFETWDHKAYYPGATRLHFRVTGDRTSGQLLGAELVGTLGAEVAKRIDVFAAALHGRLQVQGLDELDLSYTPPLGSPWDAVQQAGQAWVTAWRTELAEGTNR